MALELTVAVLGGTGPQGRGLARRWASAGLGVVIGSRSPERAAETAAELAEATGGDVRGADNHEAAASCDVVVVAVPVPQWPRDVVSVTVAPPVVI